MSNVISIDPGRKCLALSQWGATRLLGTWLSRVQMSSAAPASQALADLGQAHFGNLALKTKGMASVAVVERMVAYPTQGRKDSRQSQDAKANDLLDLQAIGAHVAAKLAETTVYYSAHEWKGQTDADIVRMRVVRELDEYELALLCQAKEAYPDSLHHNIYASLGLGLKYLGRYRDGR
jgi:hypothetical protein